MRRSTAEYSSVSSSWSTQTQAVASAPTVMPFAEFTPSTRTSMGMVPKLSPCALWKKGMTKVQPPRCRRKP